MHDSTDRIVPTTAFGSLTGGSKWSFCVVGPFYYSATRMLYPTHRPPMSVKHTKLRSRCWVGWYYLFGWLVVCLVLLCVCYLNSNIFFFLNFNLLYLIGKQNRKHMCIYSYHKFISLTSQCSTTDRGVYCPVPGMEHITYSLLQLERSAYEVAAADFLSLCEWRERMFYLTTHSTHFIYGYMASDIWLRTIQIAREETRCRHIGLSFRLAARILLYASSHTQDNTYQS